MKKIVSVSQCLSEIISDLQKDGRDYYVEELEEYMASLADENKAFHALEQIEGLCHVKILGDLHIPGLEPNDWLAKIGKLQQRCRRAINANVNNT